MRELYIYYAISDGAARDAATAVTAFQAALRSEVRGLAARVLRRTPSARAGVQTWMEVYAADPASHPDGVDAALQAAIERAAQALVPFIDGARHVESFETFAAFDADGGIS